MPETPRRSFLRRLSKPLEGSQLMELEPLDSLPPANLKKGNDGEDKRVSFSSLEIYEFLIQIGDNPSCEGAPLCIGNECQNSRRMDVNQFEANRKGRRHRKELVLSASKRSRLLMALGYSMEDIATAALEVQKARQEREESLENQKWDKFNFVFESATRKLKRIVGKNKTESEPSTVASRTA